MRRVSLLIGERREPCHRGCLLSSLISSFTALCRKEPAPTIAGDQKGELQPRTCTRALVFPYGATPLYQYINAGGEGAGGKDSMVRVGGGQVAQIRADR